MSYDLVVFRTPPGRDPDEVFDEEMEAEELDNGRHPIDDPALERCHAEIEQVMGDQATCDRCCGHVTINIPHHYEGTEAKRLFGAIAECLQRACTEDGLTVYDPQEGRVLSPQHDLAVMLRGNARGTAIMRDIQAERTSAPLSAPREAGDSYGFSVEEKKPWWRFW